MGESQLGFPYFFLWRRTIVCVCLLLQLVLFLVKKNILELDVHFELTV